ncbi:sex-lethal homolog isoform X2 [Diaphorina citri]|uniref:Sex-lethal homolog isoform X1 n=1 Tax=Diaphorina citri TaxID=121845 RepID=A0A1S3D7X3_DIACI|nr:sex-lethal homolog isoform X2 [Diaphorina citri]XP_026682265.1 sex-lethal homolog isoform X1 [Diaphorina citri]XP_026682270.1 sex-lethal homolog isoform X2 [Diaphorina citri]
MSNFNDNIDNSLTNLIINYLPQTMTEKELFSMFVTIGPVESCRVMKDNKTGYSYGFGFVNYSKEEDAAKAIQQLNGLQVQNKKLKVSYARPSGDDIKETNLYVTNLPRTITEDQLEHMFSPYGRIVQKNILKDKITGMPRGVAFVRYDKKDEAQNAIDGLNGTIPMGTTDPIMVKIAEEHGKQKAAYYAGWQAGFSQSGPAGMGMGGLKGGPGPSKARQNYAQGANRLNNNLRAIQGGAGGPGGFNQGGFNQGGGYSQGGQGTGGPARQGKFNNMRYNPVGFNIGGGYY